MHLLHILILLICTIVIILFAVLKRNHKDEKEFEKSLDAAQDEEGLRSYKRPGEKNES